ncbi:angiogenic factor with G patch and FHA domains 1 [Aplysia californica]|uniref:Angiogenic factor with G patch and FHA domains 1 n=1 Tax=Aplysia californica TaxID=6500 RepID=A0ABM0K5Z2_APLCA|nr:angiogenic factor with G patch and FHA domains 1 [Aplysia californica]
MCLASASQKHCVVNATNFIECFMQANGHAQALSHGDVLKFCGTRLLIHIHKGLDTCDECEPGQVQARLQAAKGVYNGRKKELKHIKKKYGLQHSYFDNSGSKLDKELYADKAFLRRKYIGSEVDVGGTSQPASVHSPITATNKGHKLLSKMGWKEGEGLGRDNAGISEPINVELRVNQSAGLGSSQGVSLSLDNVQDANKAKRWSQARQRYQQLASSAGNQTVTSAPSSPSISTIHQDTVLTTGNNTPSSSVQIPKLPAASIDSYPSPFMSSSQGMSGQMTKSGMSWVRGEVQQNEVAVSSSDSPQGVNSTAATSDNT